MSSGVLMADADVVDYQGLDELEEGERNLRWYLQRRASRIMSLLEGEYILEVGCGIGTITRQLTEKGYMLPVPH